MFFELNVLHFFLVCAVSKGFFKFLKVKLLIYYNQVIFKYKKNISRNSEPSIQLTFKFTFQQNSGSAPCLVLASIMKYLYDYYAKNYLNTAQYAMFVHKSDISLFFNNMVLHTKSIEHSCNFYSATLSLPSLTMRRLVEQER